MSSMINLKASKKTPTITVGVNPVTNIHVAEARSSTNVHYPGPDGVQESTAQVVDVVIVRGSPVSNDTVELSYRIFLPQLT